MNAVVLSFFLACLSEEAQKVQLLNATTTIFLTSY